MFSFVLFKFDFLYFTTFITMGKLPNFIEYQFLICKMIIPALQSCCKNMKDNIHKMSLDHSKITAIIFPVCKSDLV